MTRHPEVGRRTPILCCEPILPDQLLPGCILNGIATPCAMVASAVSSGGTVPLRGSVFRLVPFSFNPDSSPLVVELPTPPWPKHLDDYKRPNTLDEFLLVCLGLRIDHNKDDPLRKLH